MITKEKLERFRKFKGDADKWAASQKEGADEVLTGAEWTQIDKLVQRLRIEKNGFASQDYRMETERILKKNIEGAEALLMVKQLG